MAIKIRYNIVFQFDEFFRDSMDYGMARAKNKSILCSKGFRNISVPIMKKKSVILRFDVNTSEATTGYMFS